MNTELTHRIAFGFLNYLKWQRKISDATSLQYMTAIDAVNRRGEHEPMSDFERSAWRVWVAWLTEGAGAEMANVSPGKPKRPKWPELDGFTAYLRSTPGKRPLAHTTIFQYVRHLRWAFQQVTGFTYRPDEGEMPPWEEMDDRINTLLRDATSYRVAWIKPAWSWYLKYAETRGLVLRQAAPLVVRRLITRMIDNEIPLWVIRCLRWCHVTRHGEMWDLVAQAPLSYYTTTLSPTEIHALMRWAENSIDVAGLPNAIRSDADCDYSMPYVFNPRGHQPTNNDLRRWYMSTTEENALITALGRDYEHEQALTVAPPTPRSQLGPPPGAWIVVNDSDSDSDSDCPWDDWLRP